MKRALFITLIFFYINGYSQGKIIFQDEFRNNKNGWKTRNDENFLVEVSKGVLHIEKREINRIKNGCLWYNKVVPNFNTLNNFSVALHARFLSGGDFTDMIDLMWGDQKKSGSKNIIGGLYQLSFHMKGSVHLNYFNSKWSYFVKKDIKSILGNTFKPSDINKYELIQKDGFVILKINNLEVFKHLTPPIPGNSFGFQQCLKSAWEIDKLAIRQEKPKPTSISNANPLQVETSPTQINPSSDQFIVYPNPFVNTINASLKVKKEQVYTIHLIDMAGIIIQQHTKTLSTGDQNIALYADVSPGTYILKIQAADGNVLSRTIVKQQ
jgi:hypothetical protein